MKRFLAIILAAVLLVLLCAGCNSEEAQLKKMTRWIQNTKWHAVSATDVNGGTIDEAELQSRMYGMYYEFQKDGTVINRTLNEELSGFWKTVSADTVAITIGEAELTATRVDKTLEISYLGSKFVLEQE
ncbi:MAG: hypothetical protein IJC88_03280 [Oscillospiraceae bacterium]|nr:hypothetical protein [Oscillospiraceae bacterium]